MDPDLSVCPACGAKDKLKICTGCQSLAYCGRECQVAHRKAHKKECKRIAAENNNSSPPSEASVPPTDNTRNSTDDGGFTKDYTEQDVRNQLNILASCGEGDAKKAANALTELIGCFHKLPSAPTSIIRFKGIAILINVMKQYQDGYGVHIIGSFCICIIDKTLAIRGMKTAVDLGAIEIVAKNLRQVGGADDISIKARRSYVHFLASVSTDYGTKLIACRADEVLFDVLGAMTQGIVKRDDSSVEMACMAIFALVHRHAEIYIRNKRDAKQLLILLINALKDNTGGEQGKGDRLEINGIKSCPIAGHLFLSMSDIIRLAPDDFELSKILLENLPASTVAQSMSNHNDVPVLVTNACCLLTELTSKERGPIFDTFRNEFIREGGARTLTSAMKTVAEAERSEASNELNLKFVLSAIIGLLIRGDKSMFSCVEERISLATALMDITKRYGARTASPSSGYSFAGINTSNQREPLGNIEAIQHRVLFLLMRILIDTSKAAPEKASVVSKAITKDDGIQHFVGVMEKFQSSVRVQEIGCDLLIPLSDMDDGDPAAVISGSGVEALKNAKAWFPNDINIKKNADFALKLLTQYMTS